MIYPTARAVFLMALGLPVTLVVAILYPDLWALSAAWIAALSGLFVLDLLLSLSRTNIELRHDLPASIYIGETENIGFTFANSSARKMRHPEFQLTANDRFLIKSNRVKGRQTQGGTRAIFDVKADRRGAGTFERLWARWQGPMGMVWRQSVEELNEEIAVIPNTRLVKDRAIEIFSRDASFGQKIQRDRGEGTEFDALTEYMQGMDRRAIDWKHSARHRNLLAKEYQTERNHNIVFALDSGHLMCEPIRGMTKLDHSLNASLLMAYVSLRVGDKVGYFGFDEKPYFFSQPIAGSKSFPHLQRLTSSIDYSHSETNFTLGLTQLANALKRRTLIVVFTDFVDSTNAELMIENLGRLLRRHEIIFVAFRDEMIENIVDQDISEIDDISRAVIADRMLRERRLVIARLRRMGVHIVDVDVDKMSLSLLNSYLDLKRREVI